MGRVLVAGGIGGLGHMRMQFAKKFGYRVAALGGDRAMPRSPKSALSPPTPPAAAPVFLAAAQEHGSFRPGSPRLPAEPFLNLHRTPLLQCLQQVSRRFPSHHQCAGLRLPESL